MRIPVAATASAAWIRQRSTPRSSPTARPACCPPASSPASAAPASAARDDVAAVAAVARRHGLYLHVDAAWAGSAMICPEFRHLWAASNRPTPIVFNPHKWLGAQFDCSTHFIRDPKAWYDTLGIRPDFLKTHGRDGIVDYREWSVPLGRRFRALKLWFLFAPTAWRPCSEMIRNHVAWAEELAALVDGEPDFEIVTRADPVAVLVPLCPGGRSRRRRPQPGPGRAHQRRRPDLPDADPARGEVRHPLPGRADLDDARRRHARLGRDPRDRGPAAARRRGCGASRVVVGGGGAWPSSNRSQYGWPRG